MNDRPCESDDQTHYGNSGRYPDRPHYEKRLRDVVRPELRSEREEANTYTVSDSVALALAEELVEIGAYGTEERTRDIGLAYVEYIDMLVRDERRHQVTLYAHTEAAEDVLQHAAERADDIVIEL